MIRLITVCYFNLNPIISDIIHVSCADLFFILLAVISIFLFTKTKNIRIMTDNKKKRNVIYIVCGIVMIALMLLLVFWVLFLGIDKFNQTSIAFVLESLMLLAFGISWLVKGETLFRDPIRSVN